MVYVYGIVLLWLLMVYVYGIALLACMALALA